MLTAKQERFCQEIIKGANASDAYRAAYNAEKMKLATINRCAAELLENHKVTARINELRAPAIRNAQITLESHLERLSRLSKKAEEAEQFSASIKAEELCGKASGLYVSKMEVTGANGGPIELTDADRKARVSGLLALAQARREGDASES